MVSFQNQDAWPLGIGGVVLDHYGTCQPIDDVVHTDVVRGELLVAV